MINIDLRKESPQDNVNRILALESLIKYYPVSVVEEVDPRCIQEWIEEINGEDVTLKQIDLAFIIFGLPTPELRYLMEKMEKKMKSILEEQKKKLSPEQLEAFNRGETIDLTPEVKPDINTPEPQLPKPMTREERQEENRKYREQEAIKARQRVTDHLNGIVIEDTNVSQEDKIIDLNPKQTDL